MPYIHKKVGDQYCVYKKDTGKKVGCTDGNKEALRKYLAALHINDSRVSLREFVRKEVQKIIKIK